MKLRLRLAVIALIALAFSRQTSFAQIQDLSKLASGEIVFTDILWDENDKVFGYFFLFRNDSDKDNKTMEYVILDKNLNKAFNNIFTIPHIKKANGFRNQDEETYYNCSMVGDNLLLSKVSGFFKKSRELQLNVYSFQILSLKDKLFPSEKIYYKGKMDDLNGAHPIFNIEDSRAIVQAINNTSNSGYLIAEVNFIGNFQEKGIKFLDANGNLKWNYVYDPKGTYRNHYDFSLLAVGNSCLYGLLTHVVKTKKSEFFIVSIDFNTGKEKYKYVFEDKLSKYNRTIHAKEINNQLIVVGNYSDFRVNRQKIPYFMASTPDDAGGKNFQLNKNRGYYKLALDEFGKETQLAYTQWADFRELQIDEKGRMDENFRLRPTQFYFFKDGSISILAEKYKPARQGVVIPLPFIDRVVEEATEVKAKISDFILFNMNNEFKTKNISIIKKEVNKKSSYTVASDYLFHQYIKGNDGVAFFFNDYETFSDSKEKNQTLGINTLINGELTEEKIPISSKNKYLIKPYPAKEGYIMLREYNKKDKYNEVRLEKLNY